MFLCDHYFYWYAWCTELILLAFYCACLHFALLISITVTFIFCCKKLVRSLKTNTGPGIVKELTVKDEFGTVVVTMWNDIAIKSPTKAQKRVHVKNSPCEYSPFKKRMIVKVNELDAIRVCESCIHVEDFGIYSCNLFRVGSIFYQAVQYSTVWFLCVQKLHD